MITEHFRQVPSFRCMPWADPEGDPPPLKNHRYIGFPSNIDSDPLKSQSYQASIQWWAIDTSAKRHFKGVSLMGRWWSIFSGISVLCHYPPLTKCSGSAHACSACEPARLKLNCRRYFGTYNVRQRLRRACASLHSQVKH